MDTSAKISIYTLMITFLRKPISHLKTKMVAIFSIKNLKESKMILQPHTFNNIEVDFRSQSH